ncbi:MAG: hypothetical protein FJ100_21865, partial [Deltaproteobacteria bacterium]|nr:hypothetical protein [Deltaproteobacteria bacterium]
MAAMPTADATPADLGGVGNLEFAEQLYRVYQASPHSVAPEWQAWFAALDGHCGAPAPGQARHAAPTAAAQVSNRHSSAAMASAHSRHQHRVLRQLGLAIFAARRDHRAAEAGEAR